MIETKHLYSNAYNVARKVIDKLNKTLDVHFPEDEIDSSHYILHPTLKIINSRYFSNKQVNQ